MPQPSHIYASTLHRRSRSRRWSHRRPVWRTAALGAVLVVGVAVVLSLSA